MVRMTVPYLRCTKAIKACPKLEVGDLLYRMSNEVWPGGYEYIVCRRRSDGEIIKFRIEHLCECFEIEQIEEKYHGWFGHKKKGGCHDVD